ncbi:DMT family transporter [uncultured Helicobacter sp.]|uniref:DMT family transporter n=1 Tax=uncultured Helicobacter sp. TaxID=175537 RepID=UPI00374E7653
MGWLFVIIGGIIEIFWVSGLKYADTFWLYCLTFAGILASFVLMILATKRLEVSVAYAVFVGIGAAGIVVAEMLIFGEKANLLRIALIIVLLIGVLGLKLTSKSESETKMVRDISTELGLETQEVVKTSKKSDGSGK